MFSSTSDEYARSKKTDERQKQRGAVISVSTIGLGVACLLFVMFVYDRQPHAALARQKRVVLDDEGFEMCQMSELQRPEEFFNDIESVTGSCGSVVQMGKTAVTEVVNEDWGSATKCNDSQAHYQWICLDKRLKISPPDCMVYAVGVDPEFTFEHDMERFGCEVYAFDTLDRTNDHQRSQRVWFQNIRISGKSFDAHKEGELVERWRNLHQVVENLGHKHRIIDVLKIDSRDKEWEALDEFVNSNVMDQVKQLVITIDLTDSVAVHHMQGGNTLLEQLNRYYEILRMLDCDGFKIFSSKGRGDPIKVNGMKRSFSPEYEISYINTNFFH